MKQTQTRLTDKDIKRVKLHAEKEGRNVSSFIRFVLKTYMDHKESRWKK